MEADLIHGSDPTSGVNKTTEFKTPFYIVLLTAVVGLAWILDYIKTRITKKARLANRIPGASLPLVPFIGNLGFFLTRPNIKEAFSEYVSKYGRVCRMWKFHLPVIFIADGKVAETILHNPDLFEKGEDNWAIKLFFGNGLVSGTGPRVKHERKLLNPGFNRQLFDGFVEVFNKESRTLMKKLSSKFSNDNANTMWSDRAINIHPDLLRCSLEIVFQTSLGKEMHIQDEELTRGITEALEIGTRGVRYRLFEPWKTLPLIVDLLGITSEEKECIRIIKGAIFGALNDRRQARAQGIVVAEGKTKPFIDVLLDLGDGAMSDQDIFDHLVTIVGAGSDTISNAVNFTLFLLANHPEYQKRVHEELDSIFGDEMEREVYLADLSELRYLEMCLKESLRHFPPIPLLSRKMSYDVKLDNGMVLPKGADCVCLVHDIHHNPEVYPNPEVYDPERFAPDVPTTRSQGCYMPFGTGLRNCIGQKFALAEARVMLAHMLRKYEVSSPQRQHDIKFLYGIPVEPHPSIRLNLKKRTDFYF